MMAARGPRPTCSVAIPVAHKAKIAVRAALREIAPLGNGRLGRSERSSL